MIKQGDSAQPRDGKDNTVDEAPADDQLQTTPCGREPATRGLWGDGQTGRKAGSLVGLRLHQWPATQKEACSE